MKGEVIRVAIIGLGRSGRDIHGKYLASDTERYRIVAVVDELEDRRRRAEQEWGCQSYADYRALLGRADLDLVVVASPSHRHAPISLDLLNTGFNVLCEKPLARSVAQVDELKAAAQQRGKLLTVFQNARFAPYFQQVQKVLAEGVLGRIVQISIAYNVFARRWDWQTLQESYGGSLMNTGPHPIDQALLLFGEGMPQVRCYMDRANTSGDAEDHVKLLMGAAGHPVVDVEISACCAYPPLTCSIQGTQGGLKSNMSKVEWKYYLPSESPQPELSRAPLKKADGTPAFCTEQLSWHTECWKAEGGEPERVARASAGFYQKLHETLVRGKPPVVTLDQVRRQVAVMEECRRQNPHIYPKG